MTMALALVVSTGVGLNATCELVGCGPSSSRVVVFRMDVSAYQEANKGHTHDCLSDAYRAAEAAAFPTNDYHYITLNSVEHKRMFGSLCGFIWQILCSQHNKTLLAFGQIQSDILEQQIADLHQD